MKQQVARFSPHQNGKVIGVLMAVASLIVLVPIFLVIAIFAPGSDSRPPMFMVFILPVIYLVFGYLSVVIGCALYNVFVPFLGGLEYESTAPERA